MKILLLEGAGVSPHELGDRLGQLGFPHAEVRVGDIGRLESPLSAEAIDLLVGDGGELWRRCGESLGQKLREAGCAALLLVDPEAAASMGPWRLAASGVQFLSKPVEMAFLASALVYAFEARRQVQCLAEQLTESRSRLEDRKIIERAKEELAGFLSIPEADAYQRLRKAARDQQKTLRVVSENFLTFAEVLNSPPRKAATNGLSADGSNGNATRRHALPDRRGST